MVGLTRSLKYAAFRAGRVIGITLLLSIGFVFYFMFLDGEQFTVQNIISRFPSMLVFVGNLMYMIYGMIDIATYTQYTMSHGATRKDVLISTIFMHVLQIAAAEAVLLLFFALPKDWQMAGRNELCMAALLLFLVGGGLALIMGILIRRFGKAAYTILVMVSATCGGILGALIGFHGSSAFLLDLLPAAFNWTVPAVIGCVWYIAAAVVFWLFIRKMEVRV